MALYEAARNAGFAGSELLEQQPRVAELPFDAARRCIATLHRLDAGRETLIAYVNGSSEKILTLCHSQYSPESSRPLDRDALFIEGLFIEGLFIEGLFIEGQWSNRPMMAALLSTFALQLATTHVPWLNPISKTERLDLDELAFCLAMSSVVFVGVEIENWMTRCGWICRPQTVPRTVS